MSDNKKYYYLKLKDNFFDSDEMKLLESMTDGYKYSNILLKLYLRSLKNEGKLVLNNHIPYSVQMIASVTGHSVGDTKAALSIFKDLGLIEKLDNGAIYMLDIQNFIGESTTEADRIRKYRNRIKTEKQQIEAPKNKDVQMYDKRTPEIELEKELDIEKEKEKANKDKTLSFRTEIIDYMNEIYGTKFSPKTKQTKEFMNARLKEGFTKEDFKLAVAGQWLNWHNNQTMKQHLVPKTIFRASNFEGYVEDAKRRKDIKQDLAIAKQDQVNTDDLPF